MSGNTTGGNDTLIGGAGLDTFNSMRGDGDFMRDNAHGGDDTLIGGDGSLINYFFGDAFEMRDAARGGNDTLISGTGTDHMWGDAQFIVGNTVPPPWQLVPILSLSRPATATTTSTTSARAITTGSTSPPTASPALTT